MPDFSKEHQNKKQRLGRGLGSLLGENITHSLSSVERDRDRDHDRDRGFDRELDKDKMHNRERDSKSISKNSSADVDSIPIESRVWNISIEKLTPSKFQAREVFEKEKLEELAQSIRENGIIQPLVAVKQLNGSFELVAGERRWRAAQLAGLHDVPVIIKNIDNKTALELGIIENVQRENLNPIEEAKAYLRLANEFGLTQQQIATKVGKERATIANSMRLNLLSEELKTLVQGGQLSVGHAKVLLSLNDQKEQLEVAKRTIADSLSVRAIEKIIADKNKKNNEHSEQNSKEKVEENSKIRFINNLAQELQKDLGTKVLIDYGEAKGKISIYFYSDDELNEIVSKVKVGCRN